VLVLDRRVADLDTEELIAIIQRRFPGIQVVLLDSDAGFAGEETKREAERDGWNAAPESPFESAEEALPAKMEERITPANGAWKAAENRAEARRAEPLPGMIGESEAMQRVYRMARLVAPRTTTVLVAGPTGSGKELVARALHTAESAGGKPFRGGELRRDSGGAARVGVVWLARGAFTGAVQAQVGRIPAAHGGTLFLDEVSELPLGMQAKLLRFLEQKEVQRLGTAELTRVDVRVIAASNVDLAGRAGRGEFREDLVLPAVRVSAGAAAAGGAARRHRSAGRAFSGMHGGGHGGHARAERGRRRTFSKPSVEGQRARAAARDGAGVDSGRERGHGS
jgi:DNA-binding NtrC family response regulator